jgi:hypothetical protein
MPICLYAQWVESYRACLLYTGTVEACGSTSYLIQYFVTTLMIKYTREAPTEDSEAVLSGLCRMRYARWRARIQYSPPREKHGYESTSYRNLICCVGAGATGYVLTPINVTEVYYWCRFAAYHRFHPRSVSPVAMSTHAVRSIILSIPTHPYSPPPFHPL